MLVFGINCGVLLRFEISLALFEQRYVLYSPKSSTQKAFFQAQKVFKRKGRLVTRQLSLVLLYNITPHPNL